MPQMLLCNWHSPQGNLWNDLRTWDHDQYQQTFNFYFLSFRFGLFLSVCVNHFFLYSAPISGEKVFRNVLRWIDSAVCKCIPVALQGRLQGMALVNVMHKAVSFICFWCFCTVFFDFTWFLSVISVYASISLLILRDYDAIQFVL